MRISTRSRDAVFFASMLADGIPVRAKDFSQSCDDGPRILPSMNASLGHRVQLPTREQEVQVVRSFRRIERTSFIWSEYRQISRNRSLLTFPSRKWKLDAREHIAIRRYITRSMARTARRSGECILVYRCGDRTKLLSIPRPAPDHERPDAVLCDPLLNSTPSDRHPSSV